MPRAALAIALGLSCMAAQATAVYNFTSASVIASTNTDGPAVTTHPPAAPSRYGANLEFSTPLAAGATTSISAEYGGFDLIAGSPSGPSRGNVLSFGAFAVDPFRFGSAASSISSRLGDYSASASGDELLLRRYSTVTGSITTDAAANISGWSLDFTLWEVTGGPLAGTATVCTGPACTPSVMLTTVDLLLSITSAPPMATSLPYAVLNGVVGAGTLGINTVDTAFADPGIEYRSFTGESGSWAFAGAAPVPEPGTAALLLLGSGLGLGVAARRRRKQAAAARNH